MSRRQRKLILIIVLLMTGAPQAGVFSHARWTHLDCDSFDSSACSTQSMSLHNDAWICWYDGAPLSRLPLTAPHVVQKVVNSGESFTVEAIECSPWGMEWLRVASTEGTDRHWIPLVYCRRVAPANATQGNLPIGEEPISLYEGLPLDYQPDDMMRLPQQYCYNDMPQILRAEAAAACRDMLDTAQREVHLTIKILSAYRSAYTQAYLCRSKIDAEGIRQNQVARPGHSEHQLGTTVDLVGSNGHHLLDEQFETTAEGRWLRNNCKRFGFVQTYSKERSAREGLACEPWHFRYVGLENIFRFNVEPNKVISKQ